MKLSLVFGTRPEANKLAPEALARKRHGAIQNRVRASLALALLLIPAMI